jgi:hypothetical protein
MRDDFSADTIRRLGERVGLLCSNPKCQAPTKGPHTDTQKAANLGKAAHIHAASPGGPRYNGSQTEEQRSSIENAIWLCSNCAVKIDVDAEKFPAHVLKAWKTLAEHEANERIGKPSPGSVMGTLPSVELTLDYRQKVKTSDVHRYELVIVLKNVGTKRIDEWYVEVEFPTLLTTEPGTVIGTKVKERSDHRISLFRTEIGNTPNLHARKPLLVGDKNEWTLPYRVDSAIYHRNIDENLGLFEEKRDGARIHRRGAGGRGGAPG